MSGIGEDSAPASTVPKRSGLSVLVRTWTGIVVSLVAIGALAAAVVALVLTNDAKNDAQADAKARSQAQASLSAANERLQASLERAEADAKASLSTVQSSLSAAQASLSSAQASGSGSSAAQTYRRVQLGTILGAEQQAVESDGAPFTYVYKSGTCHFGDCAYTFSVLEMDATTCRSIALRALYRTLRNETGSVAVIQVVRADAPLREITVTPKSVARLTVRLDGGPFQIRFHSTPTVAGNGGDLYLNGHASCRTEDGS